MRRPGCRATCHEAVGHDERTSVGGRDAIGHSVSVSTPVVVPEPLDVRLELVALERLRWRSEPVPLERLVACLEMTAWVRLPVQWW